ncbi:hypothetical protein SteCoe_26999 [Stentor coeruleus]|uniref:Uncharacterized protein n=1 Tax=Stentor coeruleus TaxID=5963 RepID=A0A1R2BBK2_9CILI|nr:hypothetical protein SteCoe_26999 [Stentor coeruleus]
MESLAKVFLREHKFHSCNTTKRVVKEGFGDYAQPNTLIKYDIKIFRSSDLVQVENPAQGSFRLSFAHLEDPEASLPAFHQVLITMRLNEEGFISIPAGFHQENDEPWEDLIYKIRITTFEHFDLSLPNQWKFLREHKIGPTKCLKKRVISEGIGKCPNINTLVTYYYTIYKPDGCELEPYTNKSHILPKIPPSDTHLAIYYALMTMREGEDCLVHAPEGYFKYRYKSDLWFSIQLLYISEMNNALYPQKVPYLRECELGCGVIKRVIQEGEGDVIFNANKAWIEIEGWLEDSYQFQKKKEEVISFVKEGKIYPVGQSMLMKTMRKGEVSFIVCPPGTHMYEDNLEKETLWLKFTLKEYLEILPETKNKTLEEKLQACHQIKNIANRLFRSNIRSEAKSLYNTINSSLVLRANQFETLDQVIKNKYIEIKEPVLGNLALVHLLDAEESKDKDFIEKNLKKVFEFCGLALEINAKNSKVLFRRGKAYEIKGQLNEAREDIVKALEIEPKDWKCREFLRELDKKIKGETEKQKNVLRKVFIKENWEKQAKEDEERMIKIKQEEEDKEEDEQEQNIMQWLNQLQTKGVNLNSVDAVNLLMSETGGVDNS